MLQGGCKPWRVLQAESTRLPHNGGQVFEENYDFLGGAAGQNKEPEPAWEYVGVWTSDPGLGKTIDRRSKGLTRMQVTHHGLFGRNTGQSVSGLSGLICTTLSQLLSCMLAFISLESQNNKRDGGHWNPHCTTCLSMTIVRSHDRDSV